MDCAAAQVICKRLLEERDQAVRTTEEANEALAETKEELANVTTSWEELKEDRITLPLSLDEVEDLLMEAKIARDEARGELARLRAERSRSAPLPLHSALSQLHIRTGRRTIFFLNTHYSYARP